MEFADKNIEKEFKREGFVVFDFLTIDEVENLRSLYDSQKHHFLSDYGSTHSTCDTNNPSLVKFLDDNIAKIIRPKLDKFFLSYEYLLSSFLTKEPGRENITIFHQDPTLIDRQDAVSAGLWIPLQDSNRSNGCLRIIRGSHRLGDILAVTPDFPAIFKNFANKLPLFEEAIELKAGQCVMFDNKLIHGAYGNHSNQSRIACVSAIKSGGCDWVYYYLDNKKGNENIEKYLMNYEAYASHRKGEKPFGVFIEEISHSFKQITYHEFIIYMIMNYPLRTLRSLYNYFK